MTSVNLSLDPLFQSAEVCADHVLNCLHCSLCPPIALALANSSKSGDSLYQLLIRNRVPMSSDFNQRSLNGAADGWLLILFIHQLRNPSIPKEVSQAIDDRVVRALDVADRREVGMVRVQLANKPSKERLLRLAGKAVIGNENVDGASRLRLGRKMT